jgi:hypothetical protein
VGAEQINARLRDLDVPLTDLRVFDNGPDSYKLVGRLVDAHASIFGERVSSGRGAHSWGVLPREQALDRIAEIVAGFTP